MLIEANMKTISIEPKYCRWTRENRKNNLEKSVIDYIISTKEEPELINHIEIDDNYIYQVKNDNYKNPEGVIVTGKQSDHNTIITTINMKTKTKGNPRKNWKRGNESKWKKYNQTLQKINKNKKIYEYEDLENAIITAMKKEIGTKTTNPNRKPKDTDDIKEAKKKKKPARKEFEKAIREKNDSIPELKKRYIEMQKTLQRIIQQNEATKIKQIYQTILDEGGSKSQSFWKARRRIKKSNHIPEYDTMDEEENTITDPEQSKENIAKYFENQEHHPKSTRMVTTQRPKHPNRTNNDVRAE